jgi:hypothetical protein
MHQRRKSLSQSCREIAWQWHYDPRMFWTGFAIGIAVCLAIGLAAHCVREWRQRSAFIVSLSSAQREALRGFETVTGGDWRAFRDLSPSGLAAAHEARTENHSLGNAVVRRPRWAMRASPSIVPGIDRKVYLVLDDLGPMGCAWRETNVEDTGLEAIIQDLLEGQYSNPVRVVGFNVSEGWVRDVSEEIARMLRQRCADENRELPDSLHQLVEQAASTQS